MNTRTTLPADDYLATHPHQTRSHVDLILLHVEAIGLPYCWDCHDWHLADETHSDDDRLAVPRPRKGEDGRASLSRELVPAACWAVLFTLLLCIGAWSNPAPASATRVIPGAVLPDVCHNIRGTQTILDTTTGHRYRVVKVTPSGNVCRRVKR